MRDAGWRLAIFDAPSIIINVGFSGITRRLRKSVFLINTYPHGFSSITSHLKSMRIFINGVRH